MSDIRDRLAKATTEDEEREALHEAAYSIWPAYPLAPRGHRSEIAGQALAIINGPRAGWIGVPLLAMPDGHAPDVTPTFLKGTLAFNARLWKVAQYGLSINSKVGQARLPSCALMLAVLAAREVKQ